MSAKVLLVDDNYTVIKIIASYLEKEGYQVFSTTDSSKTLQMVHEISPDIILLDIVMPGLNGFEVCRLLKKDAGVGDIPVIILTAETDSRDIIKAVELGAADYIRKPVEWIEVIARVQSAYKIKQYQEKLKEMALKDGLTGIYNHACLIEQFVSTYNIQMNKGGDLSFAMIDIDFFKKINDTYGHIAGDSILREIACILSWSVGDKGIVGRYGGEEFGIIIPEMPIRQVSEFCENIRKDIEVYDFWNGESKIKVTVSIGVCSGRAAPETRYEELLRKADNALYSAKKNGRNRVETCVN